VGSVGFSVVAAIRSGRLEVNCSTCQIDPNLRGSLGCEEPTQVAVWADEENEFYSCPWKFVTSAHISLLERVKFQGKYGTLKSFEEYDARVWQAESFLEHEEVRQRSQPKPDKRSEQAALDIERRFSGKRHKSTGDAG